MCTLMFVPGFAPGSRYAGKQRAGKGAGACFCPAPPCLGSNCQGRVSQRRFSLESLFNHGLLLVGDTELKARSPETGFILTVTHIRGWGSIWHR